VYIQRKRWQLFRKLFTFVAFEIIRDNLQLHINTREDWKMYVGRTRLHGRDGEVPAIRGIESVVSDYFVIWGTYHSTIDCRDWSSCVSTSGTENILVSFLNEVCFCGETWPEHISYRQQHRLCLRLSLSLMLRPKVSRPVCLGVKHPFGAYDRIFITIRLLWVCWRGALSLTRGRICRL
jgi:hypothetical protein